MSGSQYALLNIIKRLWLFFQWTHWYNNSFVFSVWVTSSLSISKATVAECWRGWDLWEYLGTHSRITTVLKHSTGTVTQFTVALDWSSVVVGGGNLIILPSTGTVRINRLSTVPGATINYQRQQVSCVTWRERKQILFLNCNYTIMLAAVY